MKKTKCDKCKQKLPFSNLIHIRYYSYCLPCYQKYLQNYDKSLTIDKVSLRIYNLLPFIAATLGIFYLLLKPISQAALNLYLILSIILICLMLFGILTLRPLSSAILLELQLKLQNKLGNYTSNTAKNCYYHPEVEAVGRCRYCFESFCEKDFIVQVEERFCCFKCAPIHLERLRKTNYYNAFVTIGILLGVGIFLEIPNFEFSYVSGLVITYFFLFILIIIRLKIFNWRFNRKIKNTLVNDQNS